MGNWTIKRITGIDGQVPVIASVSVAEPPEYHGEWMADEMVSVTVKSPTPIDFHIDDFIDYRGDIYALGYDPNVVKKAARNTYGEGFTYDNIRLYSIAGKLKGYGFKDFVLNDNGQAYSSMAKFQFFAGSVEDLADRVQANINRQDDVVKTFLMQVYGTFKVLTPNWSRCSERGITQSEWESFYNDGNYGTWGTEGTEVTLGETDVNIDIDDTSCFEALKLSYTSFGLTWYTKQIENVCYIVVGGPAVVADKGSRMIYRYGRNLGLYEIERTSPDEQELVTRMFAYGSDKNLPLNYYANIGKRMFLSGTKVRTDSQVAGHDYDYHVHTSILYASVRNAFSGSSAPVILTNSTGDVSCTAYIVTYLQDGSSVQYVSVNLSEYIWINGGKVYGDVTPEQFYDAIIDDERLYITYGANINSWPSSYIELPEDYNYPALLSINRLMLPGFPSVSLHDWVEQNHPELLNMYDFSTDKYDPWVMSKNAPYAGVIEGTANFDGSQQKEIYPTIGNTGAGVVTLGSFITDNGYVTDAEPFTIEVADDVLDWDDALGTAQEEVTISMTSGYCVGRDFKVGKAVKNSVTGDWTLTLERHTDSSLGRLFPYYESDISNYCQIQAGDTFAVTGIQMPDEYIEAASEKLLIAALGWLDRRDHVRYAYLPKVDNIYMARQDEAVSEERDASTYGTVSLHDTLRAGMQMEFEDAADLGIERYGSAAPFIDVLTIKEDGGDGIPSYDVVLRDEKERGMLEKLTERIEELTGATNVVERTVRAVQYIEYDKWELGHPYYYNAMNTAENRLEISRVWHRGCLWECRRTLTAEEPWFTSTDWVCLRADNLALNFFNVVGQALMPMTFMQIRIGQVNFTVTPCLLIGNEDITENNVLSWRWSRQSVDAAGDTQWNASSKTYSRTINIVNADMPTGYQRGQELTFTCTATLAFDFNGSSTIINRVTF